jgi:general secretion pathway protein D
LLDKQVAYVRYFFRPSSIPLLILPLLSACALHSPPPQAVPLVQNEIPTVAAPETPSARDGDALIMAAGEPAGEVEQSSIYAGTGSFVKAGGPVTRMPDSGEVTLNFQNTPIAEVVKTILGDILNRNYVIAEGITGTVTMRTVTPVSEQALVSILDKLLRVNGAALLESGDFFEVVQTQEGGVAGLTASTKLSADKGYQVLIVPLQYIAATAMAEILEPLKSGQARIQVDKSRNLLILAGTQGDLFNLRDTIAIFDVHQLKGKSVAIYRPQHVSADVLLEELEAITGGDEGVLSDLVKLSVIERLNGILAISPQAEYLEEVAIWVSRLDAAQGSGGMNMYVYNVQNGKAENLATLLNQMFEVDQGAGPRAGGSSSEEEGATQSVALDSAPVKIIADKENNALVVMAAPGDYTMVEKAIRQLDVLPMQVLVEASILEITLGDSLEYGLQWFFKDHHGSFDGTGGLNIDNDANVPGTPVLEGALTEAANFTYAVFDAAGTRAVLNAIAGDSRLNVLSSPSLMVLDNQQATIRVGDQVPIRTSETANTSSSVIGEGGFGTNITSQIQYRDTGVTLEVTPRVNAGGMVILDITQRVDDVDETTSSNIDSPTILQREITTSVAVQSGETIVLGGLIRENKEDSDSGIPFLKDIPYLGAAFGGKRLNNTKTELIVMITPSAIANTSDARRVTDEYRAKMQGLELPASP